MNIKKLLDNPKAKKYLIVYSIASVLMVALGVGILTFWRYSSETTYALEFRSDREVAVIFSRPVFCSNLVVNMEPKYPVSAKCMGQKWLFAREIVVEADAPFVPGEEFSIGVVGVRALMRQSIGINEVVVPNPTSEAVLLSAPFVENPEGNPDGFYFKDVSPSTRIAVEAEPEVRYLVAFNDQPDAVEIVPREALNPESEYNYVVNVWEEYPLTESETEKLGVFCDDTACDFEVDVDKVVIRTNKVVLGAGTFYVPAPLLVESMTPPPGSANVHIDTPVEITFSKPIDQEFFTERFNDLGDERFKVGFPSETGLLIESSTKEGWNYETEYVLPLLSLLRGVDGSRPTDVVDLNFTTIGKVKVGSYSPSNGSTKVSLGSTIRIAFDQEVDHGSAEAAFSISPSLSGRFSWDGNTMIYDPSNLSLLTKYSVTVGSGVQSIYGLASEESYSFSFTTTHMRTVSIGRSVNGRSIYAYYFGSGDKTVLYTGGLHGNERSSARIIDSWADYLEDHPEVLPSGTRAIVVRVANPDGYASNDRFNAADVDLNRNWDTDSWQEGTYVGEWYFPHGGGSSPFSEPESRALRDLIVNEGVDVLIDMHCCAGGAWGGVTSGRSYELAALYREKTGYPGGNDGWDAYSVTGSMTTWVATKRGVPSLIVEVYSGDSFSKNLPGLRAML